MSAITAKRYYVGVDLGQMSDPTAIVIVEAVGQRIWPDPEIRKRYNVRLIERPDLGTPYKAIVDRLIKSMSSPKLHAPGYASPCLVVDQTGVGRAVVEHMRLSGLQPVGLTITGGATVSRPEPLRYPQDVHVPKRDLVGVLQMVLGNEMLRVAKSPLAAVLKKEFQNFKLKTTNAGNQQFEAWRSTDHDDLVLALATALWVAEHGGKYGLGLPPSKAKPVIKVV